MFLAILVIYTEDGVTDFNALPIETAIAWATRHHLGNGAQAFSRRRATKHDKIEQQTRSRANSADEVEESKSTPR
jgi:hypothetical protein